MRYAPRVMEYHAEATIHATPESIWALLTDAAGYPEWNPTVVRVEGGIVEGRKIKVFATVSPERAFPVKVAELVPNERMVWRGGMPLGLFKGVRTFTLRAGEGADEGKTFFSMSEVFSGPLVGIIGKSMPDLQPSFDEFANSLKLRAEG